MYKKILKEIENISRKLIYKNVKCQHDYYKAIMYLKPALCHLYLNDFSNFT